ncbi:MAG TPA: V-type ATP synthase subunit I, partial [Spirochaetia bacterium]|nr:V-type ATP synthase subunit I [Spirochaetia bacterium]
LIVWGLYFLVVFLVVGRPLMPATVWLVVGGLVIRVVFANQRGRFGKGILSGFAKLPLMLLNSVSTFSDIVSYVRLFAVGLATVAVAQSFNGMALAVGNSIPGYLAMALILLLGHGLNITLGALALIVHGVRLNLLEFSGHLEMEWTGTSYRPFALSKETLGSNKD